MSDRYLALDADFVKAEIANLIEAYPELKEDEALRLDMIEAETDAHRIIERALEQRQEAEMLAVACKARKIDLAARQSSFERKSEAMKTLIRHVMQAAQIRKVQLPEATMWITKPSQQVCIEDLDELPQGFFKREAKKEAIMAALTAGEDVPGAALVLGSEGLSIRTK